MANWSELPVDILALFAKRVACVEEFVSFGAVCKSWRCAAIQVKKGHCSFDPWLMLSKSENDDIADTQGTRRCYALSTNTNFNLPLPQLQGRRCWGTNCGWLFTFGLDLDIFLFNPLTQAKISLPSQLKFRPQPTNYSDTEHMCQSFLRKVAFSSNPSDSSRATTIMVAYGGKGELSFASPGDETWTFMKTRGSIQDIVFFKGKFYCFSGSGVLRVCYMNTDVPHTRDIASPPTDSKCDRGGFFYLVEISGNLYLINRIHVIHDGSDDDEEYYESKFYHITQGFNAYKFIFKKKKWSRRLRHLEGYALFLGNNQSFALSPLDHPQFKPDCIYYTDDYSDCYISEFSDMGIYDYKKKTIIESFDNCSHRPSRLSRSVFFAPNLS